MKGNYDKIDIYKLWLATKLSVSKRYDELLDKFESAENVYRELDSFFKSDQKIITEANYVKLKSESPQKQFERLAKRLERANIYTIFKDDPLYFENLKKCSDAPNVLFAIGVFPKPNAVKIGIVGTRRYTNEGADITDDYAYGLAKKSAVIVSGMALGVDRIAAGSAMRGSEADCATIAVLGSGADVPTPVENELLYNTIIKKGLVVSQFEPGTNATRYTFPMRNKVIAGICEALIVTEAPAKSGALITADAAIKYGRTVYCRVGGENDPTFAGTNKLVADGLAKAVNSIDDIIWDFPSFHKKHELEDDDFELFINNEKAINSCSIIENTVEQCNNSDKTDNIQCIDTGS